MSIGASAVFANGPKNASIFPITRSNGSHAEVDPIEKARVKLQAKLLSLVKELTEETMSFSSLVESMVAPSSEFKGASVAIPEIVLFAQGRPKCLVYFDSKGMEVRGVRKESKLKIQSLMKVLTSRYRARISLYSTNKGKQGSVQLGAKQAEQQRSETGLSMVNVRFKTGKSSLSQGKFTELMLERPSSRMWKEILYIQNYIVMSNVMPEVVNYVYIAPLSVSEPKEKIKYFFEDDGSNRSVTVRIQKLCTDLAHYLSKYRLIVRALMMLGNIVHEGAVCKG